MSAQNDPRRATADEVRSAYYYRRPLSARELLPALGIGIGAGAVAFYIAKLLLERTPLQLRERSSALSRPVTPTPLADARVAAPAPPRIGR
jgi:hypothetical protein